MASVGAWIEVAKTGDTVIIHSSRGSALAATAAGASRQGVAGHGDAWGWTRKGSHRNRRRGRRALGGARLQELAGRRRRAVEKCGSWSGKSEGGGAKCKQFFSRVLFFSSRTAGLFPNSNVRSLFNFIGVDLGLTKKGFP
jgi:hypothetical protein